MVEISTSILSIEKDRIIKEIYKIETAHTDFFHIDVMDGIFVENNTSKKMLEYSEYIKQISTIPLDVHLMVKDVYSYVNLYLSLYPRIITFHYEAIENNDEIMKIINLIKENGVKVGIAISPKTDIEKIKKFIPYIHEVLIMTVEPGKGGQELIKNTLEKINNVKKYVEENNMDIDIKADGGINLNNIKEVVENGANIIVSGTGILQTKDYKETINKMKKD